MIRKLIFFLICLTNLAWANQVTVTGKATLNGAADHSGTKVKFLAISPSAVMDSALTGADGSYSAALEIGIYHVEFTQAGYLPESILNVFFSENTTLNDITLRPGSIKEISGTIWGTLTSDYAYKVVGDLTVADTSSLTIAAGVKLLFDGDYDLLAYGPITALGAEQDSIRFSSFKPLPGPGDWGRVHLNYDDQDTNTYANRFSYCVFEFGQGENSWDQGGQLDLNSSDVSLQYSSFRYSGRGDLSLRNSQAYVYGLNSRGGNGSFYNITSNNSSLEFLNGSIKDFDQAIRIHNGDASIVNTVVKHGSNRALYIDDWAKVVVDGCQFMDIQNGWTVEIHDNSLVDFINNYVEDVQAWNAIGVWSNAHVDIMNNYISGRFEYSGYNSNSRNQAQAPQIAYNIIEFDDRNCCYDGIQLHWNDRLVDIHHNTIMGYHSGHRGLQINDNDSVRIHSNIIYNNDYGINSQNNGYMDYSYNAFYANNSLIQNDDFPLGFGEVVASNANDHPADIYANIFSNPQLVFLGDYDYKLQGNSPAIDAGHPGYQDADGTTSDIGARPLVLPFHIEHTPLTHTSNRTTPYTVTANITATSGQSFNPRLYYRTIADGIGGGATGMNYALSFAGPNSNDKVELPQNSLLSEFSSLTIEVWINPASTSNSTIFSNRASNGSESILLYYNAWDRRIRWHIGTSTGWYWFDGNSRLNPGQWYHIAATYDGSELVLYVNGVQDGSSQASGVIYSTHSSSFIAARRDHSENFYGYLDEFRIWNVARSETNIQADMNRELSRSEPGLVGYWRFNEGSGSIAEDNSVNQITATIHGADFTTYTPQIQTALEPGAGSWTAIDMVSGNSYSADIPVQNLNTVIDYYIQTAGSVDTLTKPYGAPFDFFRFHVSLIESQVDFNAAPQNDGTIQLVWETPILTGGTLERFNLYAGTEPGVDISAENLLIPLGIDQNSYHHTGLKEGERVYYQLTAMIDENGQTSEMVIADEVTAVSDNSSIVLVHGIVQVEGASDHSGVKIEFIPETPVGIRDSVFTATSGFFEIILPIAFYTVDITKPGCVPIHLPATFFNLNHDFRTLNLLVREIQELSGIVSGRLLSEVYYQITGDLSVLRDDTLIIDPGTILAFDGYHKMDVEGNLIAAGTETDSIYFTSHNYPPSPGDWQYIRLTNNAGESVFDYCVFEYGDGYSEWVGSGALRIEVPEVTINHSRFSRNQRGALAITSDRARGAEILNSTFNYNHSDNSQDAGTVNIRLWSNQGNITLENNRFYQNYGYDINVYECNVLAITGNTFFSDNPSDNSAIRARLVTALNIQNNDLTGKSYMRMDHDCFGTIEGNTIKHNSHYTHGIYVHQSAMLIAGNIMTNCRDGVYYQNNRDFQGNREFPHVIRNNTILNSYENGLELDNNSSRIEIHNNTIINADWNDDNGSDGAAIYIRNSTGDVFIHSNVITDSRYACYIHDNSKVEFYNNAFWNNDTRFTGTGYPDNLGQIYGQNTNGDATDIYSNLFLDPRFTDPVNQDFSLQNGSPLINAGYALYTDPDGTILDMGAWYYDHGNPHDLTVVDSDDQQIVLQWRAVERDSVSGYNLYFKRSSDSEYSFVETVTGVGSVVSGLVNNVDYDFVVTTHYPNSESIHSLKATGRPGLANIGFSPAYVIREIGTTDTTSQLFSILNLGTKDLVFQIPEDSLERFLTGYYYNNTDWDDFNELLAVRQDDRIDFDWDNYSLLPPGVPNDNFHVRWIGEVYFPVSGDYYFEWYADDEMRMSIDDQWIIWGGCWGCGNNQYVDRGWHPIIIDYRAYSNPDYIYLKWRIPGRNLEPFSGSSLLSIDGFSTTSGTVAPGSSRELEVKIPPISLGAYVSAVPVLSNDRSVPYVELPVLVLADYPFVPPTRFTPLQQSGDPFYLFVDEATVDGQALEAGDEIGLFDGNTCVGAGIVSGDFPEVVKAFGYTDGHVIEIKLWDNSQNHYARVQDISFSVGNGTFVVSAFNRCSLTGTVYESNQVSIIANQFNLISFNHYPQDPDAGIIFDGIEGLRIVYNDDGGALIPDYGINTIGAIDITEGYYLFVEETGTVLEYPGLPVDVANWTLTFKANRWNYISYLKNSPAEVALLFGAISTSIDIIQSHDGGAWIPSMGINTLGNLQPGRGYTLFLKGAIDMSFTYPSAATVLTRSETVESIPAEHFTVVSTGLPHTVVVEKISFEGRPPESGDEIGIFDGDQCVGVGVIQENRPLIIPVWERSEEIGLSGFTEGNPIIFRYFSKKYGNEFPLIPQFRSEEDQVFKGSSFTVVRKVVTEGGIIPDSYLLGQNYPNPFNPSTLIPYQLPEDTRVTLTIYNLLGQEIVNLVSGKQLAAYYTVVWDGRDSFGRRVPSGVYFYQLDTRGYHRSQKLLLLR